MEPAKLHSIIFKLFIDVNPSFGFLKISDKDAFKGMVLELNLRNLGFCLSG